MSAAEVMSIIASLDGGFNGDVPNKEIDVTVVSPTEAIYVLHHWENGVRSGEGEQYRLTLVEETFIPPVIVDPNALPEIEG